MISGALNKTEKRIGTTETLLGLISVACEKLRKRTDCPYIGFTSGELFDGLHELSVDPRFEDQFRYLDFYEIGDSFCSKALEDFLFQAGVWGMIKTFIWNNLYQQNVPAEQAKAIIGRLNIEHVSGRVKILEEMADVLINTVSRYSR